ncbi:spindle and kinetochore-associated protein 1-like [Physella acuta]|uniref:spindle and kinetochore-associated protein 1-like n=1 Tax=Physella acuta TaxID=109671 RepID=UPI0027DE9713|nr:spindle and kinetochore-associated protein 1-like [Physella acuta]
MNVSTLTMEDLVRHFQAQIAVLKHSLMLSNGSTDSNYTKAATSLDLLIDSMKSELRSLQRNVNDARKHLQSLEDVKIQTQNFIGHLQYALDNIPSKLPNKKQTEVPALKSNANNQNSSANTCKMESAVVNNGCSYLHYLTVAQFETVPKYMKGRMTYDKVNVVIEQLDNAFKDKYKLMKQKKSTLNDANRKRYETYKLQENDNTKGICFIVEKDITELTNLKLDTSTRNILTILRHCGLLHEIRGGNLVRYALY